MKSISPKKDTPNVDIYSDFGTPELRKKRGSIIVMGPDGVKRSYVSKVSVLFTYYRRKLIDSMQYEAGKAFYDCYCGGVLKQFSSTTQNLGSVGDGGSQKDFLTNRVATAFQKYKTSYELLTREERRVVYHICILENPMKDLFPCRKRKEGKELLLSGLNKLAKQYGLFFIAK